MAPLDGYDIIGDVHGQAGALRELLRRLGYRERGGAYAWPGGGRQAIFVGDFIDRNPHGREVLGIVRGMIGAGAAQATQGNHEFNAVAFHTPDPEGRGGEAAWLRPHSEKNRGQHQAFLSEVDGDPAAHDDAVAFFRALPLWLDLGGIRVVHAAWAPAHQETIVAAAGAPRLTDALLVEAHRDDTKAHAAIECLLKGPEATLPPGVTFEDNYGHPRREGRVRWWLEAPPPRLGEALFLSEEKRAALEQRAPGARWAGDWPSHCGYPASAPPVFFGHYWLRGAPRVQAPNVACVDYSAAFPGQKLVAYRWDGEVRLDPRHFVAVAT